MANFTLDPNAIKLEIEERERPVDLGLGQDFYENIYNVGLTHNVYGVSVSAMGFEDKDTGILRALELLEEKVYLYKLKNNHLNIMKHGTRNNK